MPDGSQQRSFSHDSSSANANRPSHEASPVLREDIVDATDAQSLAVLQDALAAAREADMLREARDLGEAGARGVLVVVREEMAGLFDELAGPRVTVYKSVTTEVAHRHPRLAKLLRRPTKKVKNVVPEDGVVVAAWQPTDTDHLAAAVCLTRSGEFRVVYGAGYDFPADLTQGGGERVWGEDLLSANTARFARTMLPTRVKCYDGYDGSFIGYGSEDRPHHPTFQLLSSELLEKIGFTDVQLLEASSVMLKVTMTHLRAQVAASTKAQSLLAEIGPAPRRRG